MAKPLSMIELVVRLSFIFLLVPCLSCPAYHQQSLLHFKSSLLTSYETSNSTSFGLESWDSISDCCKWTRVVCSSHSRDVTALQLGDLHMRAGYNEYRALDVRILDPIYRIRSLSFLNISYTGIEGEFLLRFLQSLDLSDYSLKDGLSREIGKLENLRSLKLDQNSIDGIPVKIGNLTRLQQFSISWNKLSGPIADSIFNLKGLKKLDVSNNYLEMHIPNRIGTLFHISILDLSGNSFTGLIPPSIRNLSELETLRLDDNMFSGEVPSWLFDIGSLKNLYLGGNKFIWNNNVKIVPRGVATKYRSFFKDDGTYAFWKQVFGVDPEIEMNDLIVNWKNAMQGISSHNQDMYSLVDLSNNKFSGDVPDSLGKLIGLKLLNLSYNKLSGYIPQSFGDLQSIETLDLSNNNISGTIPQSFQKPNQLSVLDVSNNKLSGKIPRGGQMDTMNDPSYFANNNGLCGMQIKVKCSEDEPTPDDVQEEDEDDDEQEPWFLWTGAWIGFRLGFISSVLRAFLSGYFVLPTPKLRNSL
ncbi:hypothetical protein ACET3Z_031946 [Daucus carota]